MGAVTGFDAVAKKVVDAKTPQQTAFKASKHARNAADYGSYCLLIVPLLLLPWFLGGNRLPFLLVATTLLVFSAAIALVTHWNRSLPSAFTLWSWLPLAIAMLWLSPVVSNFKRGLIQANGLQVGHDVNLEFQAFAVALGSLAIAATIPVLLSDVGRIRKFIFLLLGSAFLQTVYATYVISSGERLLYWPGDDLRLTSVGNIVASANFANRNHFAGHLEMMLFLALGVLIGYYLKHRHRHKGYSIWSRIAKALLGPEGKLRAVIIVLTAGLVMTQSRSGNIAFFSTLALTALLLYKFLPDARRAITLLFFSIVVIDVAIISNLVGLEHVADRIAETRLGEEQRVDINLISLRILSDYWLTGIGGGNYVSFVGAYKGVADEFYHIYAHNDVLQMMIELSVPVFLLLVVYVILSVRAGVTAFINRSQPFYRGIGLGAACATVSLCIHSFSDFNHQIPANSFLFVICTTLCWLCRLQNAKKPKI